MSAFGVAAKSMTGSIPYEKYIGADVFLTAVPRPLG